MTVVRGVDERLAAYRYHPSTAAGMCAWRVMVALDAPRQGKDNATQMAQAVPPGKMMRGRAPKGSVVYWDRGSNGDGHCCFALGNGTELSVDVIPGKPGKAGVVPFPWFAKNWPALRYLGWSWFWGSLDTEPANEPPEAPTVETGPGVWKWFSGKPKGSQAVRPDGKWHHLTGLDEPASGIVGGSEQRFLYLRLNLTPDRTATRVLETKFVRADGDATAYDSEEFGTTLNTYPYQNQHMEDGNGEGGKWYVKVTGGKDDPVTLTTRYAKLHTTVG